MGAWGLCIYGNLRRWPAHRYRGSGHWSAYRRCEPRLWSRFAAVRGPNNGEQGAQRSKCGKLSTLAFSSFTRT